MRGRAGFGQGQALRGGQRTTAQKLGERVRDTLVAAHAGRATDPAAAAAGFDKGALVARDRSLHRSATWLSTLAAAAWAAAGNAEAFDASLAHAVGSARSNADANPTARAFGDLVAALAGTPLADRAGAVEAAVRSELGVVVKRAGRPEVNRSQRRHLPTSCGTCGSSFSFEAVVLSDEHLPECPVCGSVL